MDLQEFQNKLYNQIPLTKLMEFKVDNIDENILKTKAPISINKNDKNTAFAGSLSTITTISAWSICFLKCFDWGYENAMIAIIDSNTKYLKPVTSDIICETTIPTIEEFNKLKKKLVEKGSGSIKIRSKVVQNNSTCVEFEGIYVIKI